MSLRYLMTIRKGGRVHTYLRKRGQPLIPLPDLPHDSPAFLAAYAAALDSVPQRGEPGTVAALIEAVLRSKDVLALSDDYRGILRRHMDAIRQRAGKAPARGLKARHVEADVAAAADPVARFKAWRKLGQVGKRIGLLADDPTMTATPPKRERSDGNPTWTPADVAAYRARHAIGTVNRAAFELLYWTAARIGDAVLIGPGHVNRRGVLTYRQNKTGSPAHVPWSCALPDYARDWSDDRATMHGALQCLSGHMTFLATRNGQTRSKKAMGTLIQKAAAQAGVAKSAHGLRKARATLIAEAGGTSLQNQAWTGHESLSETERYTRAAGRMAAVIGTEQDRNLANDPEPLANQPKSAS